MLVYKTKIFSSIPKEYDRTIFFVYGFNDDATQKASLHMHTSPSTLFSLYPSRIHQLQIDYVNKSIYCEHKMKNKTTK